VTPTTPRSHVTNHDKGRSSHGRDNSVGLTETPGAPIYLVRARDADGRRQAFAAFVRKALVDARAVRGWNGTMVAAKTRLSRQTINRWVRADWSTNPEPARVVAFCEALGIEPVVAFGILGWDRSAASRPQPQPQTQPMDPDVAALLNKLLDASVSDAEKYHIRETIRYLAYRPAIPDEVVQHRRETG
jgi:DNA-binding phage protein